MDNKSNATTANEAGNDGPSTIYDERAAQEILTAEYENIFSLSNDGSVVLLLPNDLEAVGKLALVDQSGQTIAAVEAVREVRGYRAKFSLDDFTATGTTATATTAESLLATVPVELYNLQTNKLITTGALPNLIFARAERRRSLVATTAELYDLRGAMQYRGALDQFSDATLDGWALNTTNLQSVDVIFELEGLSIGSAAARLERPDISAVLGRLARLIHEDGGSGVASVA